MKIGVIGGILLLRLTGDCPAFKLDLSFLTEVFGKNKKVCEVNGAIAVEVADKRCSVGSGLTMGVEIVGKNKEVGQLDPAVTVEISSERLQRTGAYDKDERYPKRDLILDQVRISLLIGGERQDEVFPSI